MIRKSVVRHITIYPNEINLSDEINSTIDYLLFLLEKEKIEFDLKTTVNCCSDFGEDSDEKH